MSEFIEFFSKNLFCVFFHSHYYTHMQDTGMQTVCNSELDDTEIKMQEFKQEIKQLSHVVNRDHIINLKDSGPRQSILEQDPEQQQQTCSVSNPGP